MRRDPARHAFATAAAGALAMVTGTFLGSAVEARQVGRDSIGEDCSEPFGGLRPAELSFLVATARPDTLADSRGAGPDGETDGAATAGTAFGQLAEVHRAGGAAAAEIRSADEAGQAVFVPWGFDEGCRPIQWTGSWRWARVGAEGFYRGRLRPTSEWIDGRPTFDVHAAVWEGFPVSPWEHPMSAGRPRLSATELFELYDRVPTSEIVATRPYGAVSGLVDWRRDAGELADRYPARTLLTSAFRVAELARLRTSPLMFGGTYRIRVEADRDTLATFILRTGPVGSLPIGETAVSAGSVPAAPAPSPAFGVPSVLAAAESRLGREGSATAECARELGLRVESDDVTTGDAVHAWRAELPLRFVTACFRGAAILGDLRTPPPDEGADPGTGTEGAAGDYVGTFRQESDGRFTFRQPAYLPDGTAVRLTGERIGLETLPSPAPVPDELS